MENRGRVSSAELAVVSETGIESVTRPQPPQELTDEQANEWRGIVNRMPADWFPRETFGMLVQYCRHVVSARRIAEFIAAMEGAEGNDIETYDRLLKMQEREGRAISSLATRMRISQHSLFDKTKKRPVLGKKPWES